MGSLSAQVGHMRCLAFVAHFYDLQMLAKVKDSRKTTTNNIV